MMSFEERFGLLMESGQVSEEAVAAARRILAGVVRYLGHPLQEETGAMLATHLAFAMQRLQAGEPIEEPLGAAVEEARGLQAEWAEAEELLRPEAEAADRPIPLGEVVYLTIHLAVQRQSI